jgi:transglutaminase-like putative cysteine protease
VSEPPSESVSTVGCWLTLVVGEPANIALQVSAARRPTVLVEDELNVTLDGIALSTHEIVDRDDGRQHLVQAEPGTLTVGYEGTVKRLGGRTPEPVTEFDRLVATRPSRYCPSDRMQGFARGQFGDLPSGPEQVRAICAYVWQHTAYDVGFSGPTSDAVDTLLGGRGVCRDFAHLVVALCRAVEVPARVAAVYAPGLSPMDFHVVVETALDGAWWSWDATRLAPRQTMVRIATGRDAADISFTTVLSGRTELSTVEIGSVANADLPLDDHDQLVPLA